MTVGLLKQVYDGIFNSNSTVISKLKGVLMVYCLLHVFVFFQIVDNPAEVADKADRIITMLPSSPNVIDVYTGPNGILKKVKKGSLLIDSSTIDPAVSKEMAGAAENLGAVFMDAPVSGGTL
ncbi:hypothetical protein AMECASPLE_038840 [Ameca splendens]|uniref:6-phosphogluconate dehydrogenase NADP-binding domain-containing protein n=1 Tax=Ameca splendens TaxID=208324 RepID=A0ABV0XXD7_9TELE